MTDFSIGLILTLSTGLIWGLVGVVFNHAARKKVDYASLMFVASMASAVAAWSLRCDFEKISFVGNEVILSKLLLVMGGVALLGSIGFWLMRQAMQSGHSGVAWALVQSAMVIPALAAILFFNEAVTFFKIAGLAIIVCSIISFSFSKQEKTESKSKGAWLWPALSAFALVGLSQFLCTFPSYWEEWNESVDLRLPLQMTVTFLIFAVYLLSTRKKVSKMAIRLGLLYAMVVFTGQVFLYWSIDRMALTGSISLVYPVAVGTCVVSFSLYSVFIIKEKSSRYTMLGLLGAALGITLMAMK